MEWPGAAFGEGDSGAEARRNARTGLGLGRVERRGCPGGREPGVQISWSPEP